jgi:hypothetical protein
MLLENNLVLEHTVHLQLKLPPQPQLHQERAIFNQQLLQVVQQLALLKEILVSCLVLVI